MGGSLDPKERVAVIYPLAVGWDYGAFTSTICVSLAGLLWRDILKQRGIHVRQWQFCKLNLPLVVVSMVASSAVLVGEMYVVHRTRCCLSFSLRTRVFWVEIWMVFMGICITLDIAQMIKQIDRTNVPHLFAGIRDRLGDIPIGIVFVVYITSEKTGILAIQDAAS